LVIGSALDLPAIVVSLFCLAHSVSPFVRRGRPARVGCYF
jgi:hypothetical protein